MLQTASPGVWNFFTPHLFQISFQIMCVEVEPFKIKYVFEIERDAINQYVLKKGNYFFHCVFQQIIYRKPLSLSSMVYIYIYIYI